MSHRRTPKTVLIASTSLALVLKPLVVSKVDVAKIGKELFEEFRDQNKNSFWNRGLSESMLEISYLGWFDPGTMFIQGNEDSLDNLREAFSRRVLKPPRNYTLEYLGDVHPIHLSPVAASHFIPLTEVLCLITAELCKRQEVATSESIHAKLCECYQGVAVPSDAIIAKSLNHLVAENKVYQEGGSYHIVVPEGAAVGGPGHARLVDKGTQTRRSKSERYARSKSLPPGASQTAALERSLSVREKKSHTLPIGQSPVGGAGFERSKSMHLPHGSPPVDLSGQGVPATSALSKLFRKSGKKGKKGEEKGSKATEIKTYSAQFPPDDWPAQPKGSDPGSMPVTVKAATVKRLAKVEAVEMVDTSSPPRGKRDRVHFQVPSTSTASQQTRSYSVEDTVPESEAEFIKPTKLYDDKYRTRVVSEQLRRQDHSRLDARLLARDSQRSRDRAAAREQGMPRSASHHLPPTTAGQMNDIPENGEAEVVVTRRSRRARDRRRPTSVPRNLRLTAGGVPPETPDSQSPPARRALDYSNGTGDFEDVPAGGRQGAFRPLGGDRRTNRVCAIYNSDSDLELAALSLGSTPLLRDHPQEVALDQESLPESSSKSLDEMCGGGGGTQGSLDTPKKMATAAGGDHGPSTSQGQASLGGAPVATETVSVGTAPPGSSPHARRLLHPRTRSSLSSAGDSGFNSPRGSLAGRHSSNSTPVEYLGPYTKLTNGHGDPTLSTLTSNLTLNSSRSSSQNTVKSAPGFSMENVSKPPPAQNGSNTVLYKLGEV